jgi:hypothetical protein
VLSERSPLACVNLRGQSADAKFMRAVMVWPMYAANATPHADIGLLGSILGSA